LRRATQPAMSDEIFQVERILGKRRRDGVEQYLIKWHGYSKAHNTWEPKANILDPNLVAAFEAEWAASQAAYGAGGGGVGPGPGGESKHAKRARGGKGPPPGQSFDTARGNEHLKPEPEAVADDDAASRIDLRQLADELCTLRLSEALQPLSDLDRLLRPLLPDEMFAAVRAACADGVLNVQDRARTDDVQTYLEDDHTRPLVYVWGAEAVLGPDGHEELYQARERVQRWSADLVTRDRVAVVRLPREAPLMSDLFIVPPTSPVWKCLTQAGADLGTDAMLALVVCCTCDEDGKPEGAPA